MKKIDSLTDYQKSQLAVYRDKWIDIGLSTEPADRKLAEHGVALAYKMAGLKPPEKIVWCGSPVGAVLTRFIVLNGLKSKSVLDSVVTSVRDSVWISVVTSVGDSVWISVVTSVGDSVRDSVENSVGASAMKAVVRGSVWGSVTDSVTDLVENSVRHVVRGAVWVSVRTSVWDSVCNSVLSSVWDSVGASVWDSVEVSAKTFGYGQHDATWLAYYEYFKDVCSLEKETEKLAGLWMLAKSAGWYIPHKNICWICERHNVLHRDEQGRLHKDEGMALAYPDGWGIYALHGVQMKPEYVLTPAEQIDPKTVLAEQNVDVRRELIRKVGVERMLSHLPHKKLDTLGNYELYSVRLSETVRDARYLKMLNPSIGCWHLEGVEGDTCQEALNWRAQRLKKLSGNWTPSQLT
jgi:hypothetical protein